MALQAVTPDAILTIPGGYAGYKVVTNPSGVATSGILVFIGEADRGPAYSAETTLDATFFGPDEVARAAAKYGSGPLIDALRIGAAAANDPDIQGSPQGFYLIKTNAAGKASLALARPGISTYGSLYDQSYGEPGNLISAVLTEAPAEVAPVLQFAYVPVPDMASDDSALSLRINGGAVQTLANIAKQIRPSTFVGSVASGSSTGVNSLTDILATGGINRASLLGFINTDTLAVAVSGNVATITLGGAATAWGTTPSVGDVLIIPGAGTYGAGKASTIAGAGSANLGTYIVTAATATTITATKLRDAAALTVTPPVAVGAAALATATINSTDLVRATNVVTATTSVSHGFTSADSVYVKTTATGFASGYKTITVTGATTFTYAETGSDGASDAAATAAQQFDILAFSPVTVKNISGTSRTVLATANVGATITGTAASSQLTLVLNSGAWAAIPAVGDTLYIPTTAPSAWHASGANGGYYVVTAASTTSVTLTRLSNGSPASFSATAIAAITDLVVKRPAIDGIGKSLEIYDGGDDVSISNSLRSLTGAAVTWLSTSGTPVLNVSATELEIQVTAARQSQGLTEDIVAGGDIVMLLGYTGTTGTVTISGNTLSTSVVGGSGANLSINLKQYTSVGDLAAFINSQTGYTCSPATNLMAQTKLYAGTKDTPLLILDKGTFNIGTTHGNQVARLKRDAWSFYDALRLNSLLVQIGSTAAPATAGLPEAQALSFLSGGTRGATTDAGITASLLSCEKLRANFIIPLISRDATDDITDGLTDAASTYTVSAAQAAVKTHVLKMSTFKARRHRQGFVSNYGTFEAAREAANTMASYRVALTFQAFRAIGSDGSVETFQPWAGSVYAAAMQAAGFYRSIMAKGINTSGVLSTDSSFDAESDTQVEAALLDGLLLARKRESGGFTWVSDQTTYALDTNFVYNSIQAVYAADLVTLTTAQRMERAFVGQSLADVSAASAAGVFAAIMADLKRLKLLASSDDAPAGFKNARFRIQGNVLFVEAEIKIANAIAFVPINFAISEVQQSASI